MPRSPISAIPAVLLAKSPMANALKINGYPLPEQCCDFPLGGVHGCCNTFAQAFDNPIGLNRNPPPKLSNTMG
eukprot:6684524-Karenia_brevis.AAC.1